MTVFIAPQSKKYDVIKKLFWKDVRFNLLINQLNYSYYYFSLIPCILSLHLFENVLQKKGSAQKIQTGPFSSQVQRDWFCTCDQKQVGMKFYQAKEEETYWGQSHGLSGTRWLDRGHLFHGGSYRRKRTQSETAIRTCEECAARWPWGQRSPLSRGGERRLRRLEGRVAGTAGGRRPPLVTHVTSGRHPGAVSFGVHLRRNHTTAVQLKSSA